MWYAKMYFSEGREIFQYDSLGMQGVPDVQKELPFLESLLSFQELDCAEVTPLLQCIAEDWSRFIAEDDRGALESAMKKLGELASAHIYFQLLYVHCYYRQTAMFIQNDRGSAEDAQMLDELRQTLGEDCIIYVQSIPPVRPAAAEKKPGLTSDVLRGVNEQLAQLAASKGCVYLDLWEALADGEGNLKEMIAAPDGVHLSAGNGYGAWVTYLRNHAKYSASNPWIMGSAYSAE